MHRRHLLNFDPILNPISPLKVMCLQLDTVHPATDRHPDGQPDGRTFLVLVLSSKHTKHGHSSNGQAFFHSYD